MDHHESIGNVHRHIIEKAIILKATASVDPSSKLDTWISVNLQKLHSWGNVLR